MSVFVFAMRLGIALLLGSIIGLERQWRHRKAGTRTNALVAAGAAAFVMAGLLIPTDPNAEGRIISYIVAGIGFLGAGVIFKEGANIQGLNTAATVWCSAAVGVLTGMGYPQYSILTSVAVLLTNITLRPLAYKFRPELRETDYHFEFVCGAEDEGRVRTLLLRSVDQQNASLNALSREGLEPGGQVRISAELRTHGRNDACLEQLTTRLSLERDVTAVSWRVLVPPAA
ncbi:MAG: MgtC/SapB family protein [Terriglobales bacterium]